LERGEVADFTSKAVYESIITARIEEIIQFIHDELSKVGYLKSLPAGVIFTGGGAKTIGLVEIARKILTMPLRIGIPAATMSGMSTELIDSRYSTSIGLLMNASEQDNMSKKSKSRSFKGLFGGGQSGGAFVKLKKLVQQFLP
jgi:cell division protein FtsA